MQIAIISTALAIVLFLCGFSAYKRILGEIVEVYADISYFAQKIIDDRKELSELQRQLYDYMDMTRKESLDSYRRGLQDGISAAEQKPVYAPQNPVKTMDEHVQDKQDSKEIREANKAFSDGFSAIMNYTGDIPKNEEG